MIVRLKVVRGEVPYATRQFKPGDIFEAPYKDARLLLASRKVVKMRDPVDLPPPPAAVAEAVVRKPTTLIEEPFAGESPPPPVTKPAEGTVGAMTTRRVPAAAAPKSSTDR